jgi:hypothetical protein
VYVILVYFLRLFRALRRNSKVSFRVFLFNNFINVLCDIINRSTCLIFADNFEVYRAISSPSDYLLLQSDIDRVHNWWSANFMKPNFSKIIFTYLPGKRTF